MRGIEHQSTLLSPGDESTRPNRQDVILAIDLTHRMNCVAEPNVSGFVLMSGQGMIALSLIGAAHALTLLVIAKLGRHSSLLFQTTTVHLPGTRRGDVR